MKNKMYVIVGVTCLVIAALFGFGSKLYKDSQKEKLSFLMQKNASLFVRDYSPSIGAEFPEVYVVEYLDPECESCRAFYPYTKKMLQDYGDKVKLVVRYAPFHGNSMFAIKIIEAARKQGKYWETLEVLFKYQPAWGSHHNPQPQLIWNYLPEVPGLNIDQLKKDMEDPKIVEMVNQDVLDGKELGVRYTPTFFVNGKPLEKFGYQYLIDMVKAELKK